MNWERAPLLSKDHPFFPWVVLLNIIIPTALAVFSAVGGYVVDDNIQWGLAIDGALNPWINTIYLLGLNSLVPIANGFANKYGFKRIYFLAILLFTLGSTCSGLAPNFWVLVAARAVEGIGAGLIFSVGFAFLPKVFPKEKLSLAVILYVGLSFGIGIASGLLVGGIFGLWNLWRLVFLLVLPNGFLGLIITWLFFIETPKQKVPPFDLWGYLCFVLFIGAFLTAITYGNHISTAEGWRSPFIVGSFVVALLALLSFFFIEKNTPHPFFPFRLFKDTSFSLGCLILFFVGMAVFTSASFMIAYVEETLFYDKLHTGLVLMGYGISLSVFTFIANSLRKKIPPFYLGIIGLSILVTSFFLNNLLSFQSGKIIITTIVILRGMGIAFALGPITAYSLRNLPVESSTDGATLLTFFRQAGATYGGNLLGIIIVRRQIFHDLLFAQLVNPSLPGYQYNYQSLKTHLMNAAGSSPLEAKRQVKFLIIQNIKNQSLIQAINDTFLVFAYIMIGITALLIIFNLKEYLTKKFSLHK